MVFSTIMFITALATNDAKFRSNEEPMYKLELLRDLVRLERAEDALIFGYFSRSDAEAVARENFASAAHSFNPGFDKVRACFFVCVCVCVVPRSPHYIAHLSVCLSE